MDAATGGDSGAAGGETPPATAPAPSPAPAADATTQAVSPAGSPAAAPTPAPAPAATLPPTKNAVLDQVNADGLGRVPEKHRVMKADGTLDLEATLLKNADAYAVFEKRFGSGDVPPLSPGEYKIAAPEHLKDAFKPEDPGFQKFLTDAHAAGMTQKQVDAALGAFFPFADGLIEAQQQFDIDTCNAKLKEVWPDDATFKAEWQSAIRGIKAFSGERYEAIAGQLGNSPDFVWLMAQVGKEMKEDKTVEGPTSGPSDIATLEKSKAYTDAQHKDHKAVSALVRKHYEQYNK